MDAGCWVTADFMSNTLAVHSLYFCCLLCQLLHHSHFLCSCTSVIMLLWCFLPVTCLAVSVSISRSLPIPSSHALHMRASVCTEQLLCHHATWDPVKAASGERWTSGCCLLPTHVYLDFSAKSLCDFTLDAKAFCSACHNQFTHYYKVKYQSPTSRGGGVLLAVLLHFPS